MMKIHIIIITILAVAILLVNPLPAHADGGPKAGLTIYCENLPEGEVYLDLLIDAPPFLNEEGMRYGTYSWGEDPEHYDKDMLSILKAYNVDGWRPALVTGVSNPIWGELRLKVKGGSATSHFGYFGVPDRFKIIVVTENGDVVVSNLIERKAFDSEVDFDFSTGVASERSPALQVVKQFALLLPVTLAVEMLILLLFRFSLKQNWKPLLLINLATQTALHIVIALAVIWGGVTAAFMAYIGMEAAILIAEILLFIFLLKEHSKLRRAMFALAANAASFMVGLIIMGLLTMV